MTFSWFSELILFICYSLIVPWLVVELCLWTIDRCAENRLRLLPGSPWNWAYKKLLGITTETLTGFVEKIEPEKIYTALNPERCTQQTMKTLIPYLESITDEIIQPYSPIVWDNLPRRLKLPIYTRMTTLFEPCIDNLYRQSFHHFFTNKFDHKDFINNAILKEECGYRFLLTEALHGHWFQLRKRAQIFSLLLMGPCMVLLIFLHELQPLIWALPFLTFLITLFRDPGLDTSQQKQFALSSAHWFSERIYRLPQISDAITQNQETLFELKQSIIRALQPLNEDLPLKTLTQFCLGGQATLSIRHQMADFLIRSASLPFQQSVFQQERAAELSGFLRSELQILDNESFNKLVQPCLRMGRQFFYATLVFIGANLTILYSILSLISVL